MTTSNDDCFGFHITMLKLLMIWPTTAIAGKFTVIHEGKSSLLLAITYVSSVTVTAGFGRQILRNFDDIDAAIDSAIGLLDFAGFLYMRYCFILKLDHFKLLIESMREFRMFCPESTIRTTEATVRRYTKGVLIYCIFGNIVNNGISLIGRTECNERRSSDLMRERDPCGLMCRTFYPFDISGRLFPLAYLVQVNACIVITGTVILITMTVVAVLLHTITQLQQCRQLLRQFGDDIQISHSEHGLQLKLKFIIQYHIKIITAERSYNIMPQEFLSFTVCVLKMLNIWPNNKTDNYVYDKWRFLKDISLILSLMPCAVPILADFILQLYGRTYNLTTLTENLIALNCIAGMIYMFVCFIRKRRLIRRLIRTLEDFKRFNADPVNIHDTDAKANLYSKCFLFYGIVGNIVYMLMPYLNIANCRLARERLAVDDGVPCGLVTRCRLPFQFDYSPLFEIVFLHQFYTCTMVTVGILVMTMLLCGLLMHITNQLHHLRGLVAGLGLLSGDELVEEMLFCIRYHIAIIEYSQNTNEAFSSMMLFHLTFTSLVISVLGFEMITVDNFTDSLRFGLHLFGWLVLLLLVCYYGQLLIDESVAIAEDVYFIPWFKAPVKVQKDLRMILMRAQKPLTLSAANMGVMSLSTFLRVMSSAYSYFTLLLQIKS